MEPVDKEVARARLAGLLKTAPKSMAGASIQVVRDFKKLHASASKLVASSRSTAHQLQTMLNQIEPIYRMPA